MGNIRIIGPRSSGKTTYLAALAQWSVLREGPHLNSFEVQPIGDETKELATKAESIIRQGLSLAPTQIAGGVFEMPTYQFQIKVKQRFPLPQTDVIDLVVKDYAGEIFDDLASGSVKSEHEDFIRDCLMDDVAGCLILMSEWQKGTDLFYSKAITNFLNQLDRHVNPHNRKTPLRLAVAMSKCERGELWPGRLEPEIDIFNLHLRGTTDVIRKKIPPDQLKFFAISTFGVLSRNDPRPNRIDEMGKDGRNSVLRVVGAWRPYGILAPLYWLSNGKTMRADA
jgi:hypothetical protein